VGGTSVEAAIDAAAYRPLVLVPERPFGYRLAEQNGTARFRFRRRLAVAAADSPSGGNHIAGSDLARTVGYSTSAVRWGPLGVEHSFTGVPMTEPPWPAAFASPASTWTAASASAASAEAGSMNAAGTLGAGEERSVFEEGLELVEAEDSWAANSSAAW
jgi:hypothetical protein